MVLDIDTLRHVFEAVRYSLPIQRPSILPVVQLNVLVFRCLTFNRALKELFSLTLYVPFVE